MKVKLAPIAALLRFELKAKPKERVIFSKQLYGYTDSSHSGRYTYRRKGILSDIPYIKKSRSTIIVRREHTTILKQFMKKHKAKFSEHIVILHESEAKTLNITHPDKWKDIIEDLKGSENLLVTVDF